MPERSEAYQIPSWPPTPIDRTVWNETMGDLHQRLVAREALEASFQVLIAQGVQASLDYVQVTVAPQLANLRTSIELAQEQIDQIIIGGKAPDTLKFGGQLPAYYATAQGLLDVQSSYIHKDQRNAPDGVAPLGPDSKVPAVNLPSLTTTATVGAAVAGANGLDLPDDGDAFAGVKSGASTMFRTTWGNIKTALTAVFDGRYLRLIGGVINGSLTIRPTANASVLEMRAAAGSACLIDLSPNGYAGDYNWRIVAQPDNQYLDLFYNDLHRFRFRHDGFFWTAALGWVNEKFADRGARVQREGGIWEFGSIDPQYNTRTADAPAPYVLVGLRGTQGSNMVHLRAELLRNN